ncbi:lipopolysaccharide biosynthesis protein [Kineothrix sp. MB12-C1]|uniref:lipopolysaccharide biosynthesis protein n=1 Tax=Kineothrix sp. MB12-C1 TaxID=3070215 RepID=UPI0027D2E227|nr:oligosaccharide flippase family protein [Kineothrix sp. MB12-C1]WMC92260.1 oligosaccharide flippase family protein [Kineothrix sp. MB12-C1]
MNREKALAKNTFIIAIGTFLPKFSSIITLPIITGGLTKAEMGTYDLISTLVSLFLPVATLQIQSAAFRFLIDVREDEKETKKIITNIISFILPTSLIALTILYLCLGNVSPVIRWLICLYFFSDILMLSTQQIVRGLSNNKLYSASSVTISFSNMLLIVLTISVGKQGLVGVLASITIATTIGLILLLAKGHILSRIDLSLLSKKTLLEMLSYSWPMIPNSLSNWVLSFSDRAVLTAFMGLEANAIYSVANKIPALFTTVQGTFVFAWQENASLASKDSDADTYYAEMFDSIFGILVGIMALLIAATPILFWLLIRGDYKEAYYQMPILFMGMLFSSMASFIGGIYVAHKKTRSVGVTTILAAACNLVIDLVFVHKIGIFAASISTLVSYVFLTIYRMVDVQKFQKVKFNTGRFCLLIALLVLMCAICWIDTVALNVLNIILGCIIAVVVNRKIMKSILLTLKK